MLPRTMGARTWSMRLPWTRGHGTRGYRGCGGPERAVARVAAGGTARPLTPPLGGPLLGRPPDGERSGFSPGPRRRWPSAAVLPDPLARAAWGWVGTALGRWAAERGSKGGPETVAGRAGPAGPTAQPRAANCVPAPAVLASEEAAGAGCGAGPASRGHLEEPWKSRAEENP